MALLYVADTNGVSLDSDYANGTIEEGELIVRETINDNNSENWGAAARADPANDDTVDGIVVHHKVGDAISDNEFDYVSYDNLFTYGGDGTPEGTNGGNAADRVYFALPTDGAVFRPRSIEDTSQPEPTFAPNEEVGVVDLGNGPRVVPAGYTDSGSTQYGNGGGGDYIALGHVEHRLHDARVDDNYDSRIPVRLDADLV